MNFIKYFTSIKLSKASLTKSGNVYIDSENRLHFDEITFKKGIFLFSLIEDKENLGFYIDTKLINSSKRLDTKVGKDNLSRNYILTTFTLSKQNEKVSAAKGKTLNIDFGSQIRNYVLEPYTLVKDNRSNYETSQAFKVLDGEIMPIIKSVLKNK